MDERDPDWTDFPERIGADSRNGLGLNSKTGLAVPKDLNANLRFGFLVHDVSRLRRVVVDRALKPAGITRSQWWILAFLSRRDGMTQTALAADLDLTKVAIGGLLDRMEGSGYVERRPDQRDGRIKRVHLTSSGAKFLSTIRSNIQDVEQDIMAGVGDDALQVTADTLILIKRNLRSLVDGDDGESEDT